MTLAPFVFKRYRSDLDIPVIVNNFHSNATPPYEAQMRRPKFAVKIRDNRFVLRRDTHAPKPGKVSLLPIAHGKLTGTGDSTKVHIFIRPFFTDILLLVGMCLLQAYCTYECVTNGYYFIAAFSVLSVVLAYALVVVKFHTECRNYLALIQKCI